DRRVRLTRSSSSRSRRFASRASLTSPLRKGRRVRVSTRGGRVPPLLRRSAESLREAFAGSAMAQTGGGVVPELGDDAALVGVDRPCVALVRARDDRLALGGGEGQLELLFGIQGSNFAAQATRPTALRASAGSRGRGICRKAGRSLPRSRLPSRSRRP